MLLKPFYQSNLLTSTNSSGQNYYEAIYYGRNDYPPKVRSIMSKYGNDNIRSMEVRRTPLGKVLTAALDIFTFYQIERNNPYDELYHLHLAVILANGTIITIEKNEVIDMAVNPPPREQTQTKTVSLNGHYTINSIMRNTKQRMGDKFFVYSARNCNCQDFILNILVANHLATPELADFIKQDAIRIFGDMVHFRKFSNSLTDFAGRLNVVQEGAGTYKVGWEGTGISSSTIDRILKQRHDYHGVYCKDTLPLDLQTGFYVVNLQDHDDGNGTHWCALNYQHPVSVWFDPFGIICPTDIEDLITGKNRLIYNSVQIQDIKSSACGWFCIAYILNNNRRLGAEQNLKLFIGHFSKNPLLNDRILIKMLNTKFKINI
jgi:hypothetical protein